MDEAGVFLLSVVLVFETGYILVTVEKKRLFLFICQLLLLFGLVSVQFVMASLYVVKNKRLKQKSRKCLMNKLTCVVLQFTPF